MTGSPLTAGRLFFALWPDDASRRAMARAARDALGPGGGRALAPEDLHVTLAFLGRVEAALLPAIEAVGGGIEAVPFELVFDRLAFWRKPRVLVAACSEPQPAAAALAARLWSGLALLDFDPGPRPFRPHVTLARGVSRPPACPQLMPVRWPAARLALARSVTESSGARYTVIAQWPLAVEA